MQDDFNSAQTPAGQSTPAVAQQPAQPGQPRVPGHPLGVIGANAAPQGQPNPQAQGQTPWWAGKTRPYYGSPSVGTQTELDAQPPAAWPPAAPTQQPGRQLPPSGPKPPIYQPPGMPPLAPPVAPQPPAILPAPFPAQRAVTRVSAPAPRRASRPRVSAPAPAPAAPRPGRWRRWVPLPHTLLLLGVALLLLATYLPWGVDASGNLIMLPTAGVQSLPNQSGGTTAAQVAYNLITVVGGLSVAMLLSNAVLSGLHRLLGRGCFAKSFTALFYPILVALALALLIAEALAAGFGGISALAQVPVAQSYGVAGLGMAHYELGYYLWYTGIMVNVAGMLGELVVWRR